MYDNKLLIAVLFLVFCISGLGFQCKKTLGCAQTVYNFELGIRAYPARDSISVGDTLWIELSEPTTLPEKNTGRNVDYSGAANLGTAIGIAELIAPNNLNTEANSYFSFYLQKGKEVPRSDTNRFREFTFLEGNSRYEFKLGLAPQKKGVYKMFISNAANVYRKNDECTKANFEINFRDTDQHLYLNKIVLPDTNLPAGGGVYLFKVI